MAAVETFTILVLYLALLISIGIYSSRKIKSSEGFFLADRKLSTLLCTATISGTVIGGSATIVAGGRIFEIGLPGLWYDIGGGIGLILLGIFLAYKVRQTGLITLPEITGKLFNPRVRSAAAVLIIITEIAWVSLLIQSTGLILAVLVSVEYHWLLVGITFVFMGYTILGGQYAVAYTDLIQMLVMIIGICCVATPVLLLETSSSFMGLPADFYSFPANSHIGFIGVLSIFFMMMMPHIVGPDIYSKILSARDTHTARNAALISGGIKMVFAVCIGVIALAARLLYPELLNTDPYMAVPTAVSAIHPVIGGVILASFVSVMLSSADSCLLSAGTILSVDIFKQKRVIISRAGMFIVGLGALVLALYGGGVLNTLQLAYTVFTSGLTLPILFGFYAKQTRVTSAGAFWSLILGGSVSLLWLYFGGTLSPYAVVPGLLASLLPLLILRR